MAQEEEPMGMDVFQDALILVDVQNDFCPPLPGKEGSPGGALAVQEGDRVIGPINDLSRWFAEQGGTVVATQDWHPAGHISFASSHHGRKAYQELTLPDGSTQVLWPEHCVHGSWGADFHVDLDPRPIRFIVRKGWRRTLDSYSTFFENDRRTTTGLDRLLKGLGIGRVFIAGLATDYCVLYSALDARALGFQTVVLQDAVRGVDVPPGSVDQAWDRLRKAGVLISDTRSIR
jgi:nicotinamidase/pyrazinamidase